jgi:hypothetical protein
MGHMSLAGPDESVPNIYHAHVYPAVTMLRDRAQKKNYVRHKIIRLLKEGFHSHLILNFLFLLYSNIDIIYKMRWDNGQLCLNPLMALDTETLPRDSCTEGACDPLDSDSVVGGRRRRAGRCPVPDQQWSTDYC